MFIGCTGKGGTIIRNTDLKPKFCKKEKEEGPDYCKKYCLDNAAVYETNMLRIFLSIIRDFS